VTAPFTPAQVASLAAYQAEFPGHAFTCPRDLTGRMNLVPGISGWTCPDVSGRCGYRQYWAHRFMADGSWRDAATRLGNWLRMATG
jgi:hypothetical protein